MTKLDAEWKWRQERWHKLSVYTNYQLFTHLLLKGNTANRQMWYKCIFPMWCSVSLPPGAYLERLFGGEKIILIFNVKDYTTFWTLLKLYTWNVPQATPLFRFLNLPLITTTQLPNTQYGIIYHNFHFQYLFNCPFLPVLPRLGQVPNYWKVLSRNFTSRIPCLSSNKQFQSSEG